MNLPTISIVTLNYNADLRIWKQVLMSIQKQNYPKKNIEHLVMDGGSTNGSLNLAKQFGCKIFQLPKLRDNSEGRKGIGIQKSKNDIIAIIETDNILVGSDWFSRMVDPFVKEKNIVGTYSMYNSSEYNMPALTRYCSLIGVNDPTVYYLGKSEKIPRFQVAYNKGTRVKDTNEYTVVNFTYKDLPTLGDNGHMFRRFLINKVNQYPTKFLHTDAFYKLAEMGYGQYGVVKNSIIHYSGSNLLHLYKRRAEYKSLYFDVHRSERYYFVFDAKKPEDVKKLLLFIFYSLTILEPLIFSIRGYLFVPDPSWFLHPLACIVAVIQYSKSELVYLIRKTKLFN